MPVHQHVLNWLYSVLTSEYHDVNRTYGDVAQTLTRYPSLTPRTDVHTFPNGASALLLHLSGTLPVNFRGSTYRFPLSVWVPHAYPRQPPLVYVTPTETMSIRPGQHVDPQGQVYHPYLVGWTDYWDKSTIHDFLAILSDVFAKEPPVVSRQQSQPVRSPPPSQGGPPVPPHPPEVSRQSASQGQPHPPPPPPKTFRNDPSERYASPMLQSERPSQSPSQSQAVGRARYDSAPPLPPDALGAGVQPQSPHSSRFQHETPQGRMSNVWPTPQAGGAVRPPYHDPTHQPPLQFDQTSGWHPSSPAHPMYGQQPVAPQAQAVQPPPAPWSLVSQRQAAQQPPPGPAPPPSDLMDEPLSLNIPRQSVAPPPIPPNPEKDALLVQLAQTLASMRQTSRQQNESSMAGLQAQRNAMLSVLPGLQSEMGQLNQLSNVLNSNTAILREALHKADGVIEGSRSHPAPDIDELLVAPTVVSNQLYTLAAEERALGDAIFMLGRAVEKGRVPPTTFAKMTRSLAREWYLKKALVRKIGMGMGLAS